MNLFIDMANEEARRLFRQCLSQTEILTDPGSSWHISNAKEADLVVFDRSNYFASCQCRYDRHYLFIRPIGDQGEVLVVGQENIFEVPMSFDSVMFNAAVFAFFRKVETVAEPA